MALSERVKTIVLLTAASAAVCGRRVGGRIHAIQADPAKIEGEHEASR
jgi:hypothetical protein